MSTVLDWGASIEVFIGGIDRTDDLTGAGEIDRELDASGLATIRLARGSTVPSIGDEVAISGICSSVYVGYVSTIDYDPRAQVWTIGASDNLQGYFEALADPVAVVAELPTGAAWTEDLFGPWSDGWQCAQDAMSVCPYSIWMEGGVLQSAAWAGTGYAATLEHTGGGLYDGSITYTAARLRELISAITATVEVRYNRLHHWRLSVGWSIADWDFCDWITVPYALPTRQMMADVASSNTWSLLQTGGLSSGGDGLGIYTEGLPSSGVQCGDVWSLTEGGTDGGFVWNNPDAGSPAETIHLASWKMGRNWSQTCTETYTLTVQGASGTPGAHLHDESASYAAESDDSGWDAAAATSLPSAYTWSAAGGHSWTDIVDDARRELLLRGMLGLLGTRIRASHRRTTLGATVEPGIEPALGSRARIVAEDIQAAGQVSRLYTTWDFDTQTAGCHVTLIVTDGSTSADDFSAPSKPDMSPTGYSLGTMLTLGTHIGGMSADDPEQDDAWDGWITNAPEGLWGGNNYPVDGSQTYDVGFVLTTPDVPDAARDEATGTASATRTITSLAGTVTFS